MMYLGAFLLACIMFGAVQSNGEEFNCPTCVAWGTDANVTLANCDSQIKYVDCGQVFEEPICEIAKSIYDSGNIRINRVCSNKVTYEKMKQRCAERNNCANGFCTESGCMADLPEPFRCPVCSGTGDNALADCDSNIEYEDCERVKPVCEITKKTRRFFSGKVKVYVSRQCSDEATISWLTQKCTKAGTCPERVTCKESKCMPHLPGN